MKKLLLTLCLTLLFTTADDALAKTRTIKGKLYYSSNKCLILKTVTGRKYNLKNYGALEADQRVKLEVEDVPKGEVVCDGPGRGVNVIKVLKTYPHTTHVKPDSTKVKK